MILFTITITIATAVLLGKTLKIQRNTAILIGVGTSICGGSAIAATAPVMDVDDKEVVYSISTIFLFNIVGIFLFPLLERLLALLQTGFGMWAGTTINDTSSVVAGYSFSDAGGDYTTIVKLTRTLMIILTTLALAFWHTRKARKMEEKGNHTSIWKIFPRFVPGFLATAIINLSVILFSSILEFFNNLGKFGIMAAMAGIGLNTNIRSLFQNGLRPIYLGLCCWIVVAVVSLIVQNAMGLM